MTDNSWLVQALLRMTDDNFIQGLFKLSSFSYLKNLRSAELYEMKKYLSNIVGLIEHILHNRSRGDPDYLCEGPDCTYVKVPIRKENNNDQEEYFVKSVFE